MDRGTNSNNDLRGTRTNGRGLPCVRGALSSAVSALKNLHGGDFDRAHETSEKQRVAVEKARLVLGRHRAEHRC